MLNSIYIGLSGMEAFSKGLQVISNNVANLNTTGFKRGVVSFSIRWTIQSGLLASDGQWQLPRLLV